MLPHVWGLVGALGLLIAVIFGTWGCLTASTDDPSTSRSALVAIGGVLLMGIGIVGRGQGSAAVAKVRSVTGAVGLVVAPVAGLLALLALGTGQSSAASFLVVTAVALAAWAQGIAAQVGLSFRISFVWLVTLTLFATAVLVVGVVLGAFVVGGISLVAGWLGLDVHAGVNVGFAVVLATIVVAFTVWARGRPDRLAVPNALGRASLGRVGPGDAELLAAGPGPILRRRPIAGDERAAVDARLAAADAGLAVRDDHSDD
jgi:hypothetical protein